MSDLNARTTTQVLEDHLYERKHGSLESDLLKNYSGSVILLTSYGVHQGWDGLRSLASLLEEQLPGASFTFRNVQILGEYAFLEWTARAQNGAAVNDGADGFVVRNGSIVAQTIHYRVQS